ncbi:17158_t:CDS:2, partial [Funneliformis geosporum]
MPSKNSILKRTERARTFRAEIKAKYLREQLACLRSSLYLEEQNKLLSDELLEVYHDSQELHEKIQDQNHTISLLREHEEDNMTHTRRQIQRRAEENLEKSEAENLHKSYSANHWEAIKELFQILGFTNINDICIFLGNIISEAFAQSCERFIEIQ